MAPRSFAPGSIGPGLFFWTRMGDMADRLIRDELLTSERYCTVSRDARLLFVHLMLVADDFGNFSGKNFTVRASCFPGEQIDPEALENWLSELVEKDLTRFYEISGERYINIPRFRQRLRAMRPKFPLPPWASSEDQQALKVRNVRHPRADDGQLPLEEKRSEEKGSEENKSTVGNSANPDVTKPELWDFAQPPTRHQEAHFCLAFLNKVSGSRFRAGEAHLSLIRARLAEGYTVDDVKRVCAAKATAWKNDDKMREYLRPDTIFNRTKFAVYVGQCAGGER